MLKVDNQSAISLSKNPVHHDRSKHIDLHYHFIRDCVALGKVNVEHLRTENQLADILTKSLGRVKFHANLVECIHTKRLIDLTLKTIPWDMGSDDH